MNSAIGLNNYATGEQSRYPELWRGCVGAWAMCLGPTGTRLFDFSGRQNWGTLTNMDAATDWVVSGGQYALDFDGFDDVVQLSSIPDSPNQITATAWARQTVAISLAAYAVFSSTDSAGAVIPFQLESFQGRWGFIWGDGSYVRPAVSFDIVQNQWYHIALVRAGSTANWSYRFFVDGIERLSGTTTVNPGASNPIAIGRNGNRNAQFFPGNIDDVRLYNRALSPAEIRLLASKRGIAYERQRRRRVNEQAAAANARRLRILTGQT